jgi:hypothetical protein
MSISLESFVEPDPILGALNEATGAVQQEGPSRWSFAAGPEETHQVTARMVQEWVLMDMAVAACEGTRWLQPKRLWSLLHANAELSGGVKFVVGGNPQFIRLRAEVSVMTEVGLAGRLQNACLGFQEGLSRFHRKKSAPWVGSAEPLRTAAPGRLDEDLEALCTGAGWVSSPRPDGGIAVRLEVPEGFCQATVDRGNQGMIDVWVELANEESWPRDSWKALGVFLLQAGGHLKTVRAVARPLESGDTKAGFQVTLNPSAGSDELGRAFRALSVACSFVGKEVKVLCEEVVGREDLAMRRGWSSTSCQANNVSP